MTGKKTILITGGGGAGSEALWRQLHQKYELHFADAVLEHIDPGIPEFNKHQIPLASSQNFTSSLEELAASLAIDLLVPTVDEELLQIALANTPFLKRALLPKVPFLETMLDKFKMAQAMVANGLPMPQTELLSVCTEARQYPVIVKPRQGRGSRGVTIVESREHLLSKKRDRSISGEDYIVQDLMLGQEFTVQVCAHHTGVIQAIVPVLVEEKRGITIRARTVYSQPVMDACQEIHNRMGTQGVYNVQLILTKDGLVFPFEINPRVSTTFCLVVQAGIDPFDCFLRDSSYPELQKFEQEVRLARHWTNHFGAFLTSKLE